MAPIALCITHSGDFYTIDLVMKALADKGLRPIRINSDLFPTEVRISALPHRNQLLFDVDQQRFSADEVAAVWFRKQFPAKFGDELDPELREGCIREAGVTFRNFLSFFADKPCVNPFGSDTAAENKLLQLRTAQKAGLRVPKTLITNDPNQVRDFYNQCDGKIVTKMTTALTTSMGRPDRFVYTSPVTREDLDSLDGLAYAPMIFQEAVAKDIEYRVAYVAGQTFAGYLDASQSRDGQTDWRKAERGALTWQAGTIPDNVRAAMTRLMTRLNLIYGAFDIIQTPDGDHVFLEVNPAGEWGQLQKFAGLPIAEAIAEALVKDVRILE